MNIHRKVGVIHTILHSVEELKGVFNEIMPEVEMINIVDDSLVREVLEKKMLTPAIQRRIFNYSLELEQLGCSAVLSNCSSLGEIAVIVRQALTIPFIKIDEPMARKAVMIGKRIGIVATAHTTIGPSTRLFEETAAELGKEYSIRIFFAEGAYDALLIEKDREKHDRILMAAIDKACAESDAVCLAQGSMFSIAEQCYDKQVPVLHSFRTSVEYLTHVLDLE